MDTYCDTCGSTVFALPSLHHSNYRCTTIIMQRAAEFAVQPVECCIHLNLITDQSTSLQTATAQHSAPLHPWAIFTYQRHCWLGVILLLYVFGRLFKIERHKKFKCKLIMCTTPLCMLHVYPWPIVLLPPSPFSYPFFLPLVLLPDVGSLVNQTAKHQYWLARHSLLNMQLRERSREVRTPSTRAHTHITSHHTHHIAHTHSHSQTPQITSHTLAVTHVILYMYE